jgi:hypothetical protein
MSKIRAKIAFSLDYSKRGGEPIIETISLKTKVTNLSDENIQCWCEIEGANKVGFYGGEHSWDLQPKGESGGHIWLDQLIDPSQDAKLVVKFSYNSWIAGEVGDRVSNIPVKYRWEADRARLVADY